MDQSINRSINQSTDQPINQSINQLTNQSINQSIHLPNATDTWSAIPSCWANSTAPDSAGIPSSHILYKQKFVDLKIIELLSQIQKRDTRPHNTESAQGGTHLYAHNCDHWPLGFFFVWGGIETRRFSNHESRLLSRSHTYAIIVILDLKIHQSMWIHWLFFSKNLNQRSLTPRWPLTPCLLGHMCDSTQGSLCPSPMGIHQCMWIQWSILQITTYIHTYYVHTTYRMSDHIVSYWTQFSRDKKEQNRMLIFIYFIAGFINSTECVF